MCNQLHNIILCRFSGNYLCFCKMLVNKFSDLYLTWQHQTNILLGNDGLVGMDFNLPAMCRCYPQEHHDLLSGLAPAGVDRNFCRQWSLQK
jgi:hypothetical protein